MRRKGIRNAVVVAVAAVSFGVPMVGVASAHPLTDGCPSGFPGQTLDAWAAQGYPNAPRFTDDPANGGNGDTIVCGRELGNGTAKKNPRGQVLYEFRDNNLPPAE